MPYDITDAMQEISALQVQINEMRDVLVKEGSMKAPEKKN